METGILKTISALFTQESVWKVADQLGENKGDLSNALEQVIATILRGFSSKAAEGAGTANELLKIAGAANNDGWWQEVVNWLENSDNTARSTDILKTIFGHGNVQRIADNIAVNNRIKPSSALSLMQWAAPLCLGMIGKHADEQQLDAGSLAASLSKPDMNNTAAQRSHYDQNHEEKDEPRKKNGNMKFLWPLLLLLIAFAAWWFLKSRNNDTAHIEAATVPADTLPAENPVMQPAMTPSFTVNADSTVSYILGDTITEKLPDSTILRVPANGAEALLLEKIRTALSNGLDTTAEGRKGSWINLYNIQFSKMLNYREGAVQQIRNVAAILKAYPAISIKLGGYTDNTGPADVNKKVSQQRAEKVTAGLNAAGVGAQLEKPEGYGPDFPVADNATPEGRAQNRRVSCRIVSVKK